MDAQAADEGHDLTSSLLAELRTGGGEGKAEEEALNALMVRDLPWIQSYVHHRLDGDVREHAETGDIVNEVFLKTLKQGPKFVVSSRGVFRRLMARIITNTLVSMHRRYNAKARSGASERGIASDSVLYLQPEVPVRSITEPPEKAARIEEEEWIDMAMELLDPLDQEVLHLRDAEDLSFLQIGKRVGLKEDAARMRYKRAVQKLTRAVVMIKSGKLEAVLAGLEEEANG